jgi:endonuclease/exonuclease/phosphatase (EEP) superfamily protein YafD
MKWLEALPGELVRATLLLVAFASAALAVMAWVSYLQPRLEFAASLAIPALFGAFIVGLVWLAQPEPRKPASTGPLALIAVIAWATLIVPDIAQMILMRPKPTIGEPLKVVQMNVWRNDWSFDRKLAWIKKESPDVLLLEEVGPAATQLLGQLTPIYPYATWCRIPDQPCGVVILSKRKPIDQGSSDGKYRAPNFVWAKYSTEAGEYAVVAAHLNWPLPDGRQSQQVTRLVQGLKALKSDSIVLGGDFNASGWSFPIRRLSQESGLTRLTHALPTYPAGQVTNMRLRWPTAFLPIDQVFIGPRWTATRVARGPDVGSDHYPVVVELVRPPVKRAAPAKRPIAGNAAHNEKAPSGTP